MKNTSPLLLLAILFGGILNAQTTVDLHLPPPCSEVIVGIEDLKNAEKSFSFSVYPNPANESFTIDLSSKEKIGKIEIQIISIIGKTVYANNIYSGNKSSIKTVNTREFAPGLYTIVLLRDNEVSSKNIIIQ